MDASHFALRQRPFPPTPDIGCYYPATGHERALQALLDGLQEGEGVLVLTGEPGVGKTLLGHCLLERLGEGRTTVFLVNGHVPDRASLFQAILFDLGLPYEDRGEQALRLALTDHLLQTFRAGHSTVLVVDEAHLLGLDLLQELRQLGNLEARSGKAVQVVLLGQPELLEVLRQPRLAALRQRVAVRVELRPLESHEAVDYLLHHVRLAGGRPEKVLSAEALDLLAQGTGGVPRLLNQAGSQAVRLALEAGADQVDAEAALEALSRCGLEEAVEEEPAEELADGPALEIVAVDEEAADAASVVAFQTDDPACRLFIAPRQLA